MNERLRPSRLLLTVYALRWLMASGQLQWFFLQTLSLAASHGLVAWNWPQRDVYARGMGEHYRTDCMLGCRSPRFLCTRKLIVSSWREPCRATRPRTGCRFPDSQACDTEERELQRSPIRAQLAGRLPVRGLTLTLQPDVLGPFSPMKPSCPGKRPPSQVSWGFISLKCQMVKVVYC